MERNFESEIRRLADFLRSNFGDEITEGELVIDNTIQILNNSKIYKDESRRLSNWFMKNWSDEVRDGSAVDNAIRLLASYKKIRDGREAA